MNNLNSVLLEGNLVRDPDRYEVGPETATVKFTIGVNRYYRNSQKELSKEVSFIPIQTWGGLGDACFENLTKGRGVRIVGRLKQERWEDKDGEMKERFVVVAEHVEFQPKKQSSEDESDNVTEIDDENLYEEEIITSPEEKKKKQ